MADRKSGKDWRKAYNDAHAKVTKTEIQIKTRLAQVVVTYPDAIIGYGYGAQSRFNHTANELDEYRINTMSTTSAIEYIVIIEQYVADQHPHQQQELGFK